MDEKPKILVIAGPTASGKSALAMELARQLDGELICADSLTVYKGFDIGSAKPTRADQQQIRHHLLNICQPSDPFTAADFAREATAAIKEIISNGKRPIVAGGTGLYLRALLYGLSNAPGQSPLFRQQLQQQASQHGAESLLAELAKVDPQTAQRLHPSDLFRIIRALEVYQITGQALSDFNAAHGFAECRFNALQYCLNLPRELLYQRINLRVDQMLAAGLVDEVKGLLASGVPTDCKPMEAIGYKEVLAFLKGEYDLEELSRLIKRNTRRFAKRQLTWFKGQSEMQLVTPNEVSAKINSIEKYFA
jgi:tRNA dimethylallyltransferase